MKSAPWIALVGWIAVAFPAATEACGGHRGRCHGHHRRAVVAPTCSPAVMMGSPVASPATMTMSYATPQMAQMAPTVAAAPAPATPPPSVAAVQPTYDYTAAPDGVPAYYYTYDSSGKMVIAQWMDWVFRGGRAAGQPAPPLPIIGALRNR